MTALTVVRESAPSAAEITEAVDSTIGHHDMGEPLYGAVSAAVGALWQRSDFRPETEERRVSDIIEEIAQRALDKIEADQIGAVLDIVRRIAAEMPELPRRDTAADR